MQVKFNNKGSTLIVSILGELDHHSAEYIRQKVDNEILKSTTRNVIFDFAKVSFMDSSGIGVIIGRYKNISKLNGKVAVVNASTQIGRILEMSGILRIISLYESIDTAIKALDAVS